MKSINYLNPGVFTKPSFSVIPSIKIICTMYIVDFELEERMEYFTFKIFNAE